MRHLVALLAQVGPETQPRQEVRVGLTEARVLLVGGLLLLERALTRVLDRHRGDDHEHVGQAPQAVGGDHHSGQSGVERHARHRAAEPREPQGAVLRVDHGTELTQQVDAVGHGPRVRRVEEPELLDRPEVERGHLHDDRGQVGALDLRIGELRTALEVVLGVQADADAVSDATTPPGALRGAGLRDRLDRQPLHLEPLAVPRDARQPRVDDVADARHGQGGLGDVGRQHDPTTRVRREDLLLVGRGQTPEQRQDLGVPVLLARQVLVDVADVALARQEHQDVAVARQLLDRCGDAVEQVAGVRVTERPVAHLDGIGATADLDDRCVEQLGEALDVDRGGRDDELQVGAAGEQLAQVAEQEVDRQRPLVRLVDDDGVVAPQLAVVVDLLQEQTVGHELDLRLCRALVVEPHGVADLGTERDVALLGDPLGDRPGRDAPRLRVRDLLAPQAQRDLGQLGRLAGAGLAGHDHDLVVADRLGDLVATGRDRQRVVELEPHRRPRASPSAR